MRRFVRFVPQPRLAIAVSAIAPLWLLPSPFDEYAGGTALLLLMLAVVVDVLRLPPRAAITLERDCADMVGIGDEIIMRYTISNRHARPIDMLLYDALPRQVRGGLGTGKVALRVPAHSLRTVDVPVIGVSRGVAALGAAAARTTTSLGLIAARDRIGLDDSLLVIPSLSGVRRYRLMAMQNRLDALGVRALRRRGQGQAFASLREYVRGDDPRHIDWKATYKKGKPITREFTIERSQTVLTLIDAGRGMTQLAGELPRFEQALSSALILTDVAAAAGDRVGTMVFDDEMRAYVTPQAGKRALQLVRDAYIPVRATSAEPDYAAAFRYLSTHQRKRALVVFFTDVIDVCASQALLAHVTRSAARHLVLVVALRNDVLFDAAVPRGGESAGALFERAAAEELLLAREQALERMRRAGVIVLDVSPGAMTAGVVNRYLELKARGAL